MRKSTGKIPIDPAYVKDLPFPGSRLCLRSLLGIIETNLMKLPGKEELLLSASNLSVSVPGVDGRSDLIHDVSFSVRRNEVVLLLGESGSGKTILSRALTGLFPPSSPLKICGSVAFEGLNLLDVSEEDMLPLRRHRIRYVFQEPLQSLNPLARIREQMRLAAGDTHQNDRFLESALELVGLDNSEEVLRLYPHELSIGMAQRVCIAMAVLPSPVLLIADEPTSAVDASLRRRILELLISVQASREISLILITHDLDVASSFGDRILVLYRGRIIESAAREEFFERPLHPYSRMLIGAHSGHPSPPIASSPDGLSLPADPPNHGCAFQPRCPRAERRCKEEEPDLEQLPGGQEVRCFFWK
jgi:oligopeptide/dipeptide ABC transporter ATP-binding protein